MKYKREIIGVFLICAVMVAFGLAFDPEKDQGYLPFIIFMAFATLMFFLVKIRQSDWKRRQKTVLFFFTSLVEMLWLGWLGIALSWQFTLGFMGAVCAAWFFINLVYIYLYQRRVVLWWNTAYAAWRSGGSAEDCLEEVERCEVELKNDTGTTLTYSGISLKEYILVHKTFLLKEMERNQECLALLKSIQPKIKNPEVQKALSELETEISKGL